MTTTTTMMMMMMMMMMAVATAALVEVDLTEFGSRCGLHPVLCPQAVGARMDVQK